MKERITRRYLAGLLDGEGYFGILRGNHEVTGYFYRPTIKMVLTTPEILKEICLKLGGHIHTRKFVDSNCKTAYEWASRTFVQVEKVLSYVHEYLIIKEPQADVLAEFLKTQFKTPDNKSGSTALPKEILDKRAHLYYLMRQLNHRGLPPAETKRESPSIEGEAIVRASEKSEDVNRNIHAVAV